MKKLFLVALLLNFDKVYSQIAKDYFPTIYNSDFVVPPPTSRSYYNDSTGNMFHEIFYEEYEVYEGGFKEKKYRFVNFDLLKQLKNKSIIINPNSLLPESLYGFYKKPDQKQEFIVNSQNNKIHSGLKPNIFIVLDINIDEKTNEVESLVLKKENDPTVPVLYFFPKVFIKSLNTKSGNLGDIGLFVLEYINHIRNKYQGKEFVLKYRNGSDINIPDKAFLPPSQSLLINQKKEKMKSNSQGLILLSAYYGNFFYGALGHMLMKNRFEKLNSNLKGFREKQRELMYDFDMQSSTRLTFKDFDENKYWKFEEVFLLEESGYPVITLNDGTGKRILVFADMADLLLSKEKIVDLKSKYGDDILGKLFNGEIEFGWNVQMVRFALGYENSLVSIEQTESGTNEIYGYQKLWLYFKDGKYYKQEWSYSRDPYYEVKD